MSNKSDTGLQILQLVAKILVTTVLLCAALIMAIYTAQFFDRMLFSGKTFSNFLPSLQYMGYDPDAPQEENGDASGRVRLQSQATLTILGDLVMDMPIVEAAKENGKYDFEPVFKNLSSYLTTSDYALANLETTFAGDGTYSGSGIYSSPDALAGGAKKAGFDLLVTGNEHCCDYGTDGLFRTLAVLREQELDTLGTRSSANESRYMIREIEGIRVGLISFTYADNSSPVFNGQTVSGEDAQLINYFSYDALDAFYAEMTTLTGAMEDAGADAIVLLIHWGEESGTEISGTQRAMAQTLCDMGIDVIAGSHTRTVLSAELLTSTVDSTQQTLCVYSLGTALSAGQEDGQLLNVTFSRYTNGQVTLDSANLIPLWTLKEDTGYRILPLDTDSDWLTAYELTPDGYNGALDSYNRTVAVIHSSLESVRSALANAKAELENSFY